jgi:hypothetical protein
MGTKLVVGSVAIAASLACLWMWQRPVDAKANHHRGSPASEREPPMQEQPERWGSQSPTTARAATEGLPLPSVDAKDPRADVPAEQRDQEDRAARNAIVAADLEARVATAGPPAASTRLRTIFTGATAARGKSA